jgi:hypothetical protein
MELTMKSWLTSIDPGVLTGAMIIVAGLFAFVVFGL